jgi:hypothetical protein
VDAVHEPDDRFVVTALAFLVEGAYPLRHSLVVRLGRRGMAVRTVEELVSRGGDRLRLVMTIEAVLLCLGRRARDQGQERESRGEADSRGTLAILPLAVIVTPSNTGVQPHHGTPSGRW